MEYSKNMFMIYFVTSCNSVFDERKYFYVEVWKNYAGRTFIKICI